jgi:hypothetical protein
MHIRDNEILIFSIYNRILSMINYYGRGVAGHAEHL